MKNLHRILVFYNLGLIMNYHRVSIILVSLFLASVCWAFLPEPGFVAAAEKGTEPGPVKLTEAARKIHFDAILVDGHNDLPWEMRETVDGSFKNFDISRRQKSTHTDIPRLREGGMGAQFWSAYVPARLGRDGTAVRTTLEQIETIHRMLKTYPETFEMADTVDDILRIHKSGKIASMIGIEGGHSIDNSLGVLRMYYQLGVRYMTLTHSETIDWADSATDEAKHGGLTEFGEAVVREMNRIGMLVDISHVSVDTMKDSIRVSRAPVIASHSSAYGVAEHPRNVPDEILRLMPENGGVIMVNFFSGFIVPEGARLTKRLFDVARDLQERYQDPKEFRVALNQWRADNPYPAGTVHTVVDHIDHIVKVAGIDHVGLGGDYDGVGKLPKQLEDVSGYPYITQELLNRGYNREQIHKILGGNALRALKQAEEVATNR